MAGQSSIGNVLALSLSGSRMPINHHLDQGKSEMTEMEMTASRMSDLSNA